MATTSIWSRNCGDWLASHDLSAAAERPATMSSSRALPVPSSTGGQVDDDRDEPVGVAGVRPAVLINADDPDSVESGGVGGHDHLGGVHGDGVDGVPGQTQLPGHRRDGHSVDHQPAQDVAGAPPRRRPARTCEPGSVVGEHFPWTLTAPDTGSQLLFRLVAAAYERRSLAVASHWP